MSGESYYGSPVDTRSEDAASLYVYSVESFVKDHDKRTRYLDQAINSDSSFVSALCLRAFFRILDCEGISQMPAAIKGDIDETCRKVLNILKEDGRESSQHDRAYAGALKAWSENRVVEAANILDELLLSFPTDLLTLKLTFETYDTLGDVKGKRHVIPRIVEQWSENVPGYSHVLAMHAKALVDDGAFEEAEDLGMRALAVDHFNAAAMTAVASAMIAQCRPREAIRLTREFRDAWKTSDGGVQESGAHEQELGWHWILGEIEQGQYANALHRFRGFGSLTSAHSLENRPDLNARSWGLVPAVSLLQRLRMCGVDVSDLWSQLSDRYDTTATEMSENVSLVIGSNSSPSSSSHSSYLYAAHLAMLLTGADRIGEAKAVVEASREFAQIQRASSDSFGRFAANVGVALCEGMQAALDDPAAAANILRPIRHHVDVVGGSFLHRDMIQWLLIDCCIRSEDVVWGRAISQERVAKSPGSAHAWRLHAEILHATGNFAEADRAYIRSLDLGLGQGGSHSH